MKVRMYKIFAKSELEHIQSLLGDIVMRWIKSWAPDEHSPVASVTAVEQSCVWQKYQKWNLTTANTHQWVAIGQDDGIQSKSGLLTGCRNEGSDYGNSDSVLSVALMRIFMQDLAESIINQAPSNSREKARDFLDSTGDLPADARLPGSGAVCLEIFVQIMSFVLILSPELTRSYLSDLASTAQTSMAFTPMRHAIGSTRIEMKTEIGDAVLSLGDLRKMKIGDVIRLDTKLAQPVQLSLNKRCVCTGFLGTYSSNKVVLLKSSTS